MQKDLSYHEAAIMYNRELAEFAEKLASSLKHEEVQRWCKAVAKQHRFHAKRHQSSLANLEKLKKADETKDTTTTTDSTSSEDVSNSENGQSAEPAPDVSGVDTTPAAPVDPVKAPSAETEMAVDNSEAGAQA